MEFRMLYNGETNTWADGGRKFGELMEKATGLEKSRLIFVQTMTDKRKSVEESRRTVNGDQYRSPCIPILIYCILTRDSMQCSLPIIYDSYHDDADAKFDR